MRGMIILLDPRGVRIISRCGHRQRRLDGVVEALLRRVLTLRAVTAVALFDTIIAMQQTRIPRYCILDAGAQPTKATAMGGRFKDPTLEVRPVCFHRGRTRPS